MENGIMAYTTVLASRMFETDAQCTNAKLAVVLDSLLVVLLDVVREVVYRDIIILDVLHNLEHPHEYAFPGAGSQSTYTLLESTELARRKGVGLTNDRDNVHAGREATHQLDINLP